MHNERIQELQRQIEAVDKRNERNKFKRNIKMILLFSAVFFLVMVFFEEQSTFIEYLGDLVSSLFLGGIYFFVNALIFSHFININNSENRHLENLKKELDELTKYR